MCSMGVPVFVWLGCALYEGISYFRESYWDLEMGRAEIREAKKLLRRKRRRWAIAN